MIGGAAHHRAQCVAFGHARVGVTVGENHHASDGLVALSRGEDFDAFQPARREIGRTTAVDRAHAANSNFKLTDANASAVAQICHRLDGIPLAIELAAARIKVLSVDEIAARLNDRFSLLTSGSRTALPRQQTLRALVDWSYDLLSEEERVLLRRLAVFSGGWTLEAAEAAVVPPRLNPITATGAAIPIEERPAHEVTHLGGQRIAPAFERLFRFLELDLRIALLVVRPAAREHATGHERVTDLGTQRHQNAVISRRCTRPSLPNQRSRFGVVARE